MLRLGRDDQVSNCHTRLAAVSATARRPQTAGYSIAITLIFRSAGRALAARKPLRAFAGIPCSRSLARSPTARCGVVMAASVFSAGSDRIAPG